MLQCEINLISRTYALKVKFRKLGGGGGGKPTTIFWPFDLRPGVIVKNIG